MKSLKRKKWCWEKGEMLSPITERITAARNWSSDFRRENGEKEEVLGLPKEAEALSNSPICDKSFIFNIKTNEE